MSDATKVEYSTLPAPTALPFSERVSNGSRRSLRVRLRVLGVPTESHTPRPGRNEAETRQTLANMKAILERHDSSLDRIVKCTVMLADMGEWPAMNAV